jgi:radical SAM protein with 4Fe4S-binding SPASM domain
MGEPERIEEFLSKRPVQHVLRWLTKQGGDGDCVLSRVMATYGQPNLSWAQKLRYGLPHLGMEWVRKRTGASVELVRDTVLGSPAWRRGLTNAARGVGEFGLGRPQVFSAPLMVVWNFTQNCNLQCRHCYQNAGTPRGAELSLSEKMHVLDELAYNDVPMLAFSGGEPLLGRDFWPVLAQARARGFHISVATNGTLLTREVVARLAETGAEYVEVSIDSTRPGKHDEFRGRHGYWQKAVAGLKNLVADGRMGTGLACTVTAWNFDELEDIIRMSKDLGVGMFYVFNFIPTGRAREIADIDLTPVQRERMLEIMQTQLDTGFCVMGTAPQLGRRCLQHYRLGGTIATGHYGASSHGATPVLARYIGGCGAGRCLLAVQPNGDLTPCVFLPLVIGSLRRDRLHDLWRTSAVLDRLRNRELLQGHCGVCEWKSYCGGCRARAYGYFGDLTEADPGCLFNAEAWQRVQSPDGEAAELRRESAAGPVVTAGPPRPG